MLKGEIFLNCWYEVWELPGYLSWIKILTHSPCLVLLLLLGVVTANNHHVSFFIDATRPEGRQSEAKRWKWGLDQSYKQTFQIKGLLQQQVTVLHITSNSSGPWCGSHWKCGKILRRLSFSDILPNTLLPVCFFVSRSLFLLKCSCWEDKMTEKSCLQPQHNKESIQGQIRLRYLTSKP